MTSPEIKQPSVDHQDRTYMPAPPIKETGETPPKEKVEVHVHNQIASGMSRRTAIKIALGAFFAGMGSGVLGYQKGEQIINQIKKEAENAIPLIPLAKEVKGIEETVQKVGETAESVVQGVKEGVEDAGKWLELQKALTQEKLKGTQLETKITQLEATIKLNNAGFETEKVALEAKHHTEIISRLAPEKAKGLVFLALIYCQGRLLNNALASEKDQIILGLVGLADGMVSFLHEANEIVVGGFIEAMEEKKKDARKVFLAVEDAFKAVTDLDDLWESTKLKFSEMATWFDNFTNKVTQPLEGLIDKLCGNPKIASLRSSISLTVQKIEIEIPAQIQKEREEKAKARAKMEESRQKWVDAPWGFPIGPGISLLQKMHQWAEERGETALKQIEMNRNLIAERINARKMSNVLVNQEGFLPTDNLEELNPWAAKLEQAYSAQLKQYMEEHEGQSPPLEQIKQMVESAIHILLTEAKASIASSPEEKTDQSEVN